MRVFRQKYKAKNGKTRDSAKWYVEVKDHNETVRRIPGFTDNKATQEFGRRLEKLVAVRTLGDTPGPDLSRWLETLPSDTRKRLAKYGLLDARTVANSKPLSEHLADFHASLLHKGDSKDHADLVTVRARKICEGCKFKQFADFNPSKCSDFCPRSGTKAKASARKPAISTCKQSSSSPAGWYATGGRVNRRWTT